MRKSCISVQTISDLYSTVESPEVSDKRAMKSTLKVGLLNANSISSHEQECLSFFEKHKLDLMFIQDARISMSKQVNTQLFNNSYVSGHIIRKTDPYLTQVVLHKRNLSLNILPCAQQECVVIELSPAETGRATTTIVSAYARPQDPVAIVNIREALKDLKEDTQIVLMGDLNAKFPEHGSRSVT